MLAPLDNHQRFLLHLDRSQDALFVVARHLYRQGNSLKMDGVRKRPKSADPKDFADNGDIYIQPENEFDWQRIEVKGLSVDFTNANDWPYKSKFLVCAKHSYDDAEPKPNRYYILNKAKTHAAIVDGKTSILWTVESRADSRYINLKQDFYLCPMEIIKWQKL